MRGARASGQRRGITVGVAIVGGGALDVLEHDVDARRLAGDPMRRAHDHGWAVVAHGDLSGSVVCHAEAFFDSVAAAERSAHAIRCPSGTVLEWAHARSVRARRRWVPVALAGAQAPGPRFTPPGGELVVVDNDGLETVCASPDEALAHIRSMIECLAVRLGAQYPAQEELPG